MANEHRIADIIAARLSQYLSNQAIQAQAFTRTSLVIQAHLQTSISSEHRVIDLGTIDLSDIVSLLPSDKQRDSINTLAYQQNESQRTLESEQRTQSNILPTPPKSPSGASHTQDTGQPSKKRRKVVGELSPVSASFKAGPTQSVL
ncbi:MAG: hypothetical protein L6R38_003684 [Xanthoria sp. 2 TBL-2021]|nr:MAG: hypothetical protein L6R38_003684 [Xanthoria sp. 2 TBL-2021]